MALYPEIARRFAELGILRSVTRPRLSWPPLSRRHVTLPKTDTNEAYRKALADGFRIASRNRSEHAWTPEEVQLLLPFLDNVNSAASPERIETVRRGAAEKNPKYLFVAYPFGYVIAAYPVSLTLTLSHRYSYIAMQALNGRKTASEVQHMINTMTEYGV